MGDKNPHFLCIDNLLWVESLSVFWAMSVSSLLMVDISEEGVEPLSVGNSLSPGFD
jgi:hypothetical protein